jgi:hypothetical protein
VLIGLLITMQISNCIHMKQKSNIFLKTLLATSDDSLDMRVCVTEVTVRRSARRHDTMHINTRGETHRVVFHSHHYIRQTSQRLVVDTPFLCIPVAKLATLVFRSVRQRMMTVAWIWTNTLLYVQAPATYSISAHCMYLGATDSLRQFNGTCCWKLYAAVRWKAYRMIINWSSWFVSDHLPTSVGEFQVRSEKSWP